MASRSARARGDMGGGLVEGKPAVAISLGDPSGIGPEVVAASLSRPAVRRALIPVVFGDASAKARHPVFAKMRQCAPETLEARVEAPTFVQVTRLKAAESRLGRPSLPGGRAQLDCFLAAVDAAKRRRVEAISTAPVSKEQISRAGFPFRGHTEVLAEAFRREVLMLMAGPRLRVALATNHLPLAEVPSRLKTGKMVRQLRILSDGLSAMVGRRARIAVLALNPHAGEGGLVGKEEARIIAPAVARARGEGIDCEGPFAADGFFARPERLAFDGVLAMYHDQGLIPAKALDFERTVNVTLGLPVPRTSPDHGVAYSLAGRAEASAVPMTSALLLAAELSVAQRKKASSASA